MDDLGLPGVDGKSQGFVGLSKESGGRPQSEKEWHSRRHAEVDDCVPMKAAVIDFVLAFRRHRLKSLPSNRYFKLNVTRELIKNDNK